jgi:hypothetical protein
MPAMRDDAAPHFVLTIQDDAASLDEWMVVNLRADLACQNPLVIRIGAGAGSSV